MRNVQLNKLNPPSLAAGQAADYTMLVSNTGSSTSGSTVQVSDQLPPNFRFNSATPLKVGPTAQVKSVNCTANGQLLNCSLDIPGGIPVNGQVGFTLNVTPLMAAGGSSAINRAYIDPTGANGAPPAGYPANCTGADAPVMGCVATPALTVKNQPLLSLIKANPPAVLVGQAASYGLILSNQGSLATGTSLVLYDQLPPNLQYSGAAVVAGGTVTPSALNCTASGQVASGQLLSCTLTLPAGGLPAGGTARLSISAVPQLAAAGLPLVNKAAIDPTGANAAQTPSLCTDNGVPSVGCAVTQAMVPGLQGVSLGLSKTSPPSLKAGVSASYGLLISNTGINASPLTLTVLDQLPPNLQFNGIVPSGAGTVLPTGASCTPTGDVKTGLLLTCTVQLPLGGLPSLAGSAGLSISVTPTQAASGQAMVNKAAIDPQGSSGVVAPSTCVADGQPSAGCAVSSSVQVMANPPRLALSKTNPDLMFVGMLNSYSLLVSNTGQGASDTTLMVSDQLPPNLAFTSALVGTRGAVIPSGVSCTASGLVTTGQLVSCNLSLPAGGLPPGGSAEFLLSVTPQPLALNKTVVNKAAVDPGGQNASVNAAACVSTGNPAGCAVTDGIRMQPSAPLLQLRKTNPPALLAGKQASYGLLVTNKSFFSFLGNTLVVYDDLPANVAYNSAAVASTGSVRPTAVACVVASGTVATGQSLRCTLTLPAGGLNQDKSAGFTLNVTPNASSQSQYIVNSAAIDSSGQNTAQAPSQTCMGTDLPMGCDVTSPLVVGGGTIQFTVKRVGGGTVPATFNINQGTSSLAIGSFYEDFPLHADGDSQTGAIWGIAGKAIPALFSVQLPSPDWSAGATCQDTNAAATGNPAGVVQGLPSGGGFVFLSLKTYPGAAFGCTVTVSGPKSVLTLSKSNPVALAVGLGSNYPFSLSNSGNAPTGTTLTVYDQLPPYLQFNGVAASSSGTVSAVGLNCTASGQVATGQSVACTLSLPAGGLPTGGSVAWVLNVLPQAQAGGTTVVNRAAVDPTGSNAAMNPGSCTANGSPAGCAVTQGFVVRGSSLTLGVISGMPASYTFTGNNGWAPQTITVSSGASLAMGTPQALTDAAATTLNLGSSQSSVFISSLSCSGLGTGKASFSGTSLTLDANATAKGNAVVCMVSVGVGYSLSLSKLSVGGTGSFTFSGNNGWANQTVVTTVAGTAVGAPAQALLQPGTALRLSESAPTGWALTLVSCVDKNAAASGNPTGAWQARVLDANSFELGADVTRPAAQLSCTVTNSYGGFTISGQVLVDNGLGNGTAHDGVQNGAEQGQAGVKLSLSNCSGTVYSTGQSDGAGHFSLGTGTAPPGPVCLQQSLPSGYVLVSAQGGTAGAIYNRNSDALVFNLGANTSYSGLLFGNVPVSLLTGEGSQQVQPGQSATYGHIYTAGTSASLSLSSTDSPSVSGQSWNSVVYQDLNCNGQLDASDVVIPATQTLNVVAGQQICLLVRVFSPANASALSTDRTRLMAMEVFQPAPAIAIGVSIRYQYKEDLSTVSSTGAALVLLKQVRKVGNCPSTAADTLAFAVSNQAAPGDYVEYQITYSNQTAGPVKAIQVSDAVPAYTVYRSGGCGVVPAGLQSCSLAQQPAVGGTGSLLWVMADAPATAAQVGLQSGGSGTVQYCVQVQR